MGKRGYGEGTIYQYRGKWRAQLTIDGKRISFSSDTRKECYEWIRKTLNQVDRGLTYDSTRTTFGEFLNQWLSLKKSSLRYQSYLQYQRLSRLHILPHLSQVKFKDLNPSRLQQYYNLLTENEVGIPTIQLCHAIVRGCLGHALKIGLIIRNPCDACVIPKAQVKEMKVWNESQVSQFLVTIKGHRNEHLFRLALATGMRQGELIGLQWSDIDWNGSLNVSRQVVRYHNRGFEFVPPKTKFGRRTITLGDQTLDSLRDQQAKVDFYRAYYRTSWQENDLIFPSSRGTPLQRFIILRQFKNLTKLAGLPEIRFHDLRHTAASLMLNHGIPVIVVSRILGHARPSITLDRYGHLMPGMQSEAANLMDTLVHPVEVDFGS